MSRKFTFRSIATSVAMFAFFAFAQAQEGATFEFAYDAGAEVVSTYLWRGLYNGGLSFQPDLAVGWDSEKTSFRFGTWWSLGASDWKFRKGWEEVDGYNPNTYFMPELDIYANVNLWGATFGFTHYYYFKGSNFFSAGDIQKVEEAGNTSQTEVNFGYDFETLLGVPLTVTWNTIVSGEDGYVDGYDFDNDCELYKRAYSTYIEIAYKHTWEKYGLSLGGTVGFSPWKGLYTDYDKDFAVNNLSIRLEKEWSLGDDLCTVSVFGVGMLNTCNINKDNVVITNAAGDDKLYNQKLNGAIGVSVWF